MAGVKEKTEKYVFGLDIGTRTIVGTVGYLSENGKFHVVGQRFLEQDTRAMIDGQIHDIVKVSETIRKVKKLLEKDLSRNLTDVCVAAAGRVLRTVTRRVEIHFDNERDVTKEDISELSMKGVQSAYEQLYREVGKENRFYCVGHTIMHYYVNEYPLTNPEGHRGSMLAADLIATFLPDEVVDGLYKAVELAELRVANLTLEPIAAMHVAIPEKYRLLNMALVDVGAGTSDICITRDGTITAYGMLPLAGDKLTDTIATHYLVDFETAEQMKRQIGVEDMISYVDIMGLQQTVSSETILDVLDSTLNEMTSAVAKKILALNGGVPVRAVFIVGGGGIIPGYTKRLADELDISEERVAIRGREVMQNIVFERRDARKDSMMVTPIGICYSYYEPSNNFIFVNINGVSTKLYDNGRLTISDAAMSAKITNEDLFPRRGKTVAFTVNGRSDMKKGRSGEPSFIKLNGAPAGLHDSIRNGDQVEIQRSGRGEDAVLYVKQLPEMEGELKVKAQDRIITFYKRVEVNGEEKSKEYRIKDGDNIQIYDWYTLDQITSVLAIPHGSKITVNHNKMKGDARIYDGYSIEWELPPELVEKDPIEEISPEDIPESQGGTGFDRLLENIGTSFQNKPIRESAGGETKSLKALGQEISNSVSKPGMLSPTQEPSSVPSYFGAFSGQGGDNAESEKKNDRSWLNEIPNYRPAPPSPAPAPSLNLSGAGSVFSSSITTGTAEKGSASLSGAVSGLMQEAITRAASDPTALVVEVNGMPVTLKGKNKYVYVDVFNFYTFDLTPKAGKTIVTLLNGKQAEYMGSLKQGDKIELYWEDL